MRRPLKLAVGAVGVLLACVVLLIGAVLVAGNTDSGRAAIERLTYRLTDGQVRLSGLGGSFPSQLTLSHLELVDGEGAWLTADDVSLRWFPLRLLERRIAADTLHVTRLNFERTPISKSSGGTVSVPDIEVAHFALDSLRLGAPLVGTPATLAAQGNLHLRSLQDANADVEARRIGGDGEYSLQLRFDPARMDAALTVSEPASGPLENLLTLPGLGALSVRATLKGPRGAEQVEAAVHAGELQARIQGNVDLTHASADLAYDIDSPALAPRPDLAWARLALHGNWHGSLAAPSADGKLQIERLTVAGDTKISNLSADLAAADGTLELKALIQGLEIPGPEPRILSQDPVTLSASLRLGDASWPLELTASHRLATLHARAILAGQQQADIELRLPDLAPFARLAAQDVRGNALLKAQLKRQGNDATLALDASLGLDGGSASWIGVLGPRPTVQLTGALSAEDITLQQLKIEGRAASVTASASAARALPHELQARWQLQISNLTALSADLAGKMTLSGSLQGSPASVSSDANMTTTLSVRGSALGTVEAAVHARGLPASPSGTVEAHGTLDAAPLKIDVAVDRTAAGAFRALVHQAQWKSARVDGDLTVNTALTESRGQLNLHIAELGDFDRLLGVQISGNVEGTLGFDPAAGQPHARLKLDASQLAFGEVAGDVHLQAAGPADALNIDLSANLPQLYGKPAQLSAAALLNLHSNELRIASASSDYRGQTIRLLAPARLSFAHGVSVDTLRIGSQGAVFEVQGQLSPELDLQASLQHVSPSLVNTFLPELLAGGTLDAEAHLQGTPANPTGTVQLDASKILFADDAATGLPPVEIHGRAQLQGETAAVSAILAAGAASQLTLSGTTPLSSTAALDLKLGGKLDVGLANPLLEARGLHATGDLTIDASITGSAGAPQVGGGVSLARGSLRDYGRGINLSDINAQAVGSEGTLQIKSFKATAASGSVSVGGSIGVLQAGIPVDLKITAKNAQPIAGNIVTANLDADIHVSGTARKRLDVAGTIHVNRATIDIPNSLPPDVAVLDVRRRGQAAIQNDQQLVIGLDVGIHAPQQILVQGRGLDAELGGDLHIGGTTDDPAVSGGFDLQRGTFTLGTKLNFPSGYTQRVSFDSAGLRKKIDPTLEFTAQASFGENTISVHISGAADAPRFDLSSSTGQQQDEIMAMLLFNGENAASITALQAAQIAATLATLSGVGSGSGPNPLVRLQRTLGLDRLNVGSNTTTTATGATAGSGEAIEAGRYVSKRVYIEGKQTTTGTSQVQVDVDVTKHLKLQTRLGNGTATTQGTTPENDPGSSVGLSYQFEY